VSGQFAKQVGRVTPCAPPSNFRESGAHGVTHPTCLPVVIRPLSFVILPLVFAASLHAIPTRKGADDIPPLAPPLPVIPPSFLEQHGWLLWLAILSVLLVVAIVTAILLRPSKPPPLPAVAAQARATLAALQARPEDGATLGQISQALRRYLIATFWLSPGEATATEFCAALAKNAQAGPELSAAVSEFLKHCDERKFSPSSSPTPTGAASRALELIDLAEARRAQLHSAVQAPKPA